MLRFLYKISRKSDNWILLLFQSIRISEYKIPSKSDDFLSNYYDITIFEMAVFRHVEFSKPKFSLCRFCVFI